MGSKRKVRWLAFGSVGAIALTLSLTAGLPRVVADLGLSSEFDVFIEGPVVDGQTFTLQIFSDGANPPANIPIGVDSFVVENVARGTSAIQSVQTVLGGTLDTGTGQITGELQNVTATQTAASGPFSDYTAVVNAGLLDFQPLTPARGSVADQIAEDLIRTVVIAEGYYSGTRTVSNIAEAAEIGLVVRVSDLSSVDTDGNLIPDATALLNGPFPLILFGGNGNITIVWSINDILRGAAIYQSLALSTALGPMDVEFGSPSLGDINTAGGTTYDTARMIVTLGADPSTLLDGPAGVNPLGEFDSALGPAPQNLFARVNAAFTTVGVRGVPPTWDFPTSLPGGLQFNLELSGAAIAAVLQDGVEVEGYTYDELMSQSGEDIVADGLEDGWDVVDGIDTSNQDSADDADDGVRAVIAADGDDTVIMADSNVSAIYGSNATPSLSGGGGGGGNCFIATAAFGTPLATEIEALRGVRDQYLLSNSLGMVFADAYYKLSPMFADDVAQSGTLKQIVRTALLPVIAASKWILASPGSVLLIIVTLIASAAFIRRMRRA